MRYNKIIDDIISVGVYTSEKTTLVLSALCFYSDWNSQRNYFSRLYVQITARIIVIL
jgi:hypothetical protein